MTYITIGDAKYEMELIELAEKHITGNSEGRISEGEARDLIEAAKLGLAITDIEKATLVYIRKNYDFTVAAASFFDAQLTLL